jgi:hypothetical protein
MRACVQALSALREQSSRAATAAAAGVLAGGVPPVRAARAAPRRNAPHMRNAPCFETA